MSTRLLGTLLVACLGLVACDEAPPPPEGTPQARKPHAQRGDVGERALLEQTESDAGALGGAAQ